ncbi:DUF2069 domain-containing protein [Massilia terrae]|uniref:DUF2069 domain-containing protein n=1 Tax=Massilia terrae TaxID=1811224 RepID=A0ABT2CU90_9BURK|nr:DUF2069 domain-containing protein [Massilia terrae]MCS0657540.1 DUF2069 domain-containing protein [Massilia terrae]
METQKFFHAGAIGSLVVLIGWLVAWEVLVAPLHPGGSLLALKVLPLFIPLRGVLKRELYTLQWSSMVILLYFTEGVVRAWADQSTPSRIMAGGEVLLSVLYYACALLFLRPYKQKAKRLAKELLDKVKVSHD